MVMMIIKNMVGILEVMVVIEEVLVAVREVDFKIGFAPLLG